MKHALVLCVAVCFGLLAIGAQAQISPRYFFSADGQEVADSKTNLIWRRCVEGMIWNGATCTGDAKVFTHEEALLRSAAVAGSTGVAWRIPKENELFSIANKTGISPDVFSSSFPATPPSWYWSDSPVVGVPGYFLSVGFCDDASGVTEIKNSSKHHVRLVRAVR